MAQDVPYQPGMILGRTFNLQDMSSGMDIFPEHLLKDVKTTRSDSTMLKYSVIKTSQDINNVLGISGDISLRAKAGLINVKGLASFSNESIKTENTVNILAKVHVQTVTETMKSTKPKKGWNKHVIGTHFVRSITYGGDLVVSIEIGGCGSKQKDQIKTDLEMKLNMFAADIDGKTSTDKQDEGRMDYSHIKINYYSTTTEAEMPQDVDGMLTALRNFKSHVLKIEEGRGVPLVCELVPLGYLDPSIPYKLRTKVSEDQMQTLEDNYDDVRSALSALKKFTEKEGVALSDTETEKIKEFTARMDKVLNQYNSLIPLLGVTAEHDQIKHLLDEYKSTTMTGGFYKEVTVLIKSLKPTTMTEEEATVKVEIPAGIGLDLVLVGARGQGKSSTGDTILGEKRFLAEEPSNMSNCMKIASSVDGIPVNIVDIPGDMVKRNHGDVFAALAKILLPNKEGFHAFLLVIKSWQEMNEEERTRIGEIRTIFGDILSKYTVIVFTGGDTFRSRMKKERKDLTLDQYLMQEDGPLKDLLEGCKGRYVLINNMETDEDANHLQVNRLMRTVASLASENSFKRYDGVFKLAVNVDLYPEIEMEFAFELDGPVRVPAEKASSDEFKLGILKQLLYNHRMSLKNFARIFFPDQKLSSCCIS